MSYITVQPRLLRRHSDFQFPHFGNILNEVMRTSLSDIVKADNKNIRFTVPAANVVELSDQFVLELAVPGLSKKEINILIEDDKLIISTTIEEGENIPGFTLREFNFNKFERSFILPDSIDQEKINASFKSGILKISLAKREEEVNRGPQKIKIS